MEDTSIHEFDFALIWDFFAGMERQGPGSDEETIRALGFIDNLANKTQIADLGCGTGTQTMVLAEKTAAAVTALDLCPDAIAKLKTTAAKRGLQNRVQGLTGSMDNLPFQPEQFDLIWSEGAIANIGFEKGLRYWKNFLKKDGYVAVTYESWFTETRPAEIAAWWLDAVPEMATIAQNVALMQKTGYIPVATFTLSESCWTDNYFTPQKACREAFLKKHAGSKAAAEMMAFMKREADLYEKYKQYYGYVFYIGKKI